MRLGPIPVAIAVAALSSAGPALADTTLFTAAFVAASGQGVACAVTNLGGRAIEVEVAIVNGDGTEAHPVAYPWTVNAAESVSFESVGPAGNRRCRFSGNFARGKVQAAGHLRSSSTTLSSLPAS